MKRIICSLPNASTRINGIKFEDDHGQKVSEPVSAEVADQFSGIPGYEIVDIDDNDDDDDGHAKATAKPGRKPKSAPVGE